jgi:hypothetical protein
LTLQYVQREYTGHFFDRDTMRFFKSRISDVVYNNDFAVYFVTSEQFVSTGYAKKRAYTVRRYDKKEKTIETVGPFNEYSRAKAHRMAKYWCMVNGRKTA